MTSLSFPLAQMTLSWACGFLFYPCCKTALNMLYYYHYVPGIKEIFVLFKTSLYNFLTFYDGSPTIPTTRTEATGEPGFFPVLFTYIPQ